MKEGADAYPISRRPPLFFLNPTSKDSKARSSFTAGAGLAIGCGVLPYCTCLTMVSATSRMDRRRSMEVF